jgi:hypothetical protein
MSRPRLLCGCTGAPDAPNQTTCPAEATQEDFLCDHCRAVQCPTRTSHELDYDYTLCARLGCPEHTVPGSHPIAVPF